MSQSINDTPVALLPWDLFTTLLDAAGSAGGLCMLKTDDGSPSGMIVSSYKFLEEIASKPEVYGEWWKSALISAGVVAGGNTVGFLALSMATGPLAPFTAIAAAIAAPFFGANRMATLIVCNATQGDIKMSEVYQDCGVQTARPVYSDTDIDTGSVRATKPDVIPGITQLVPGLLQGGIGMYRFEKNLDMGIGFYGTGGAISWTCSDPDVHTTMAFSWLVPETGDMGMSVTADLSKYSSLQDFYEKTAGARKTDRISRANGAPGKDPRIKCSAMLRGFPDSPVANDMCFTIYLGS